MFQKLSNSWQLVKASAQVLRADKELVVFPMISGLALILVSASFVAPLFLFGSGFDIPESGASILAYIGLFLFYMVQYTVIFFFNTALVGAAMIRLEGGDPTVGDGLRIAFKHLGSILGYALIASTVGLILKTAREKSNGFGKLVIGLIGMAWNLATFLVVPVLVTQNVGPIEAIKRSASILKKTWGEQIVGNAGIGFLFGVLSFLTVVLFVPLFIFAAPTANPWLIGTLALSMVAILLTLGLLNATLSGIYSAALYRFATGHEGGQFDNQLLRNAFRPK